VSLGQKTVDKKQNLRLQSLEAALQGRAVTRAAVWLANDWNAFDTFVEKLSIHR
jgi:hypothetical protein